MGAFLSYFGGSEQRAFFYDHFKVADTFLERYSSLCYITIRHVLSPEILARITDRVRIKFRIRVTVRIRIRISANLYPNPDSNPNPSRNPNLNLR